MTDRVPPARKYAGPIIDAHAHPRLTGFPAIRKEPHRPVDYLRSAHGLDLRSTAVLVIARRGALQETRRWNDRALEFARRSSTRFFALCSVHPLDGEAALREVDRVAREGARGLKLHPNTQDFDVANPAVRAVVTRATDRGLPLLFDAYSPFDAHQPGKFVRLAMEVPRSRIVLAHAHGPRFLDLIVYEFLSRYDWWKRNVWVDLSAIGPIFAVSPFREQFTWVLRTVGVDRLIFGSDYPFDEVTNAVERIASLDFSPQEQAQIFYSNAAELFGLRGTTSGARPQAR